MVLYVHGKILTFFFGGQPGHQIQKISGPQMTLVVRIYMYVRGVPRRSGMYVRDSPSSGIYMYVCVCVRGVIITGLN